MRTLNLASRPFRNERLPSLLSVLALAAVLAVSVYHVLLAREVMPERTSGLMRKLAEMEAESTSLRRDSSGLGAERTDAATLAQWTRIKDLVDRRVFSWSGLFSVLEDTMPDGVRLVSVAPKVEKGEVTLQIIAVARTFDEALQFMTALKDRPEFSDVWPTQREGFDEPSYQYDMRYRPQVRKAVATPAPSPEASAEPAPVDQTRITARRLP